MNTVKYYVILTISVLMGLFLILATQTVRATETSNLLNNGSFDNQTEGWELDGTANYDGNDYGEINKSVRFSGANGGSISQTIHLGNINSEKKYVEKVHGSIVSIGCNNEGDSWCTTTGTANNLDPVNTTITFSTKTQSEVIINNFTSDYNDGTITSTFTMDLDNDFHINETIIDVNVHGADTGDKAGQFGSIIDDLSLTLTLANPVIVQPVEVPEIIEIIQPIVVQPVIVEPIMIQPVIVEPVAIEIVAVEPVIVETIQIGSLDATSIVDTLSSGIIDINPPEDMQIANLSPQMSVISDITTDQMNMDMADVGHQNEMPINMDVGADVPVDNDMPEIDMPDMEMPDLTDMPTSEMPDVQMPDSLPEINDIQIESVNEIQNEPETLQEIREEIPEVIEELPENIEELPSELEEANVEEDLKENQNEQQEETSTANEEVDGTNEESELSDDSSTEEKEPESKEEISENEEKESEEKEETAEEEIKEEPIANEEKVVKTAKSSKSEKKQGSDSPKSSDKKTSVASTTPKIKSDIVVQELDLLTVVSFNKEYFEVKITDTLDLTTTEIDFYDGQDGFNNQDYAKANSNFFNKYSNANSEWDLVSKRDVIKIEQFRR